MTSASHHTLTRLFSTAPGSLAGHVISRDAPEIIYVTRFYRTDPNRTSGKIKLTPPVDSYTIVLQVLTLSTTQTTRGWFLHTSFLGGVECSNGGFRPCEGPGLARVSGLLVDSLIMFRGVRHMLKSRTPTAEIN